jgi:hypothetical protein
MRGGGGAAATSHTDTPPLTLLLLLLGCNHTLAGCKTGLSGFVTAGVVGLVLLVLTPVFEKLTP